MEKLNQTIEKGDVKKCKHGKLTQEFCEECLEDSKKNQPGWNIINKLRKDSRVGRSSLDINCTLTTQEGEVFTINKIKSKDDPNVKELFPLLEQHFQKDSLNTPESFLLKLEGKTSLGKDRPSYQCYYIKNNEDKIIGLRVSEQIPLKDVKGNQTNEEMFYAIYIAIAKEYRGLGIARELYISSLIDAMQNSEKNNRKLNFVIGECSARTEKLQNEVGLKRIYLKRDEDLHEIKYYQPPMYFDTKTGQKISGEPAEHLMISKISDGQLTKEDLSLTIRNLHKQYQSGWPKESFSNDEAFENHEDYYTKIYQKISEEINNSEDIIQLSAEERENLIKEGKSIIDFEEADKR